MIKKLQKGYSFVDCDPACPEGQICTRERTCTCGPTTVMDEFANCVVCLPGGILRGNVKYQYFQKRQPLKIVQTAFKLEPTLNYRKLVFCEWFFFLKRHLFLQRNTLHWNENFKSRKISPLKNVENLPSESTPIWSLSPDFCSSFFLHHKSFICYPRMTRKYRRVHYKKMNPKRKQFASLFLSKIIL